MQVIFRVDASIDIGSGHVMRCLALADAMQSEGIHPHFVCRDLPGHLADRVRARNFDVTLLPLEHPYRAPDSTDDYAGRLQVRPMDDAENFLASFPGTCDLIIVDHYGLDEQWERKVRKHCDKLIVIDDLCRPHYANFVIDQTLGRQVSAYSKSGISHALTGARYALLPPAYYRIHEQLDRSTSPEKHRLLLSLGGSDPLNITGEVLDTLADHSFSWIERVDVVLPATALHYSSVAHRINELGTSFILHDFVDNFAELIRHSTLSIGAPGSTAWERATLGLPAVLVPFAENQLDIAAAMQQAKAAIVIDRPDLSAELPAALETLRKNWRDYVLANLSISDGLGCRRVLQHIQPVLSKDQQPVWLEAANAASIRQVFKWQQMPEIRRYARNPKPPTWEEHNRWMQTRLQDPGCYFYLLQHAGEATGVVRLDRLRTCEYEVSIFLVPGLHGRGLGRLALALLSNLHQEITIHATVLPENIASLRLFASAGYERVSETEFILPSRL